MDFMPGPANALPGVEVPLLDTIPMHAVVTISATSTLPEDHADYPQENVSKYRSSGYTVNTTAWDERYWVPNEEPSSIKQEHERGSWKRFLKPQKFGELDRHTQSPLTGNQISRRSDSKRAQLDQGYHKYCVDRSDLPSRYQQWFSFPKRSGLTLEIETVLNTDQAPERLAALLQSWAFFGLIELVFDQPIVTADWTRRLSPNGPELVRWPQRFLAKSFDAVTLEWKQRSEHYITFLSNAMAYSLNLCTQAEHCSAGMDSSLARVLLSVRLLYEALDCTTNAGCSPYLTRLMLDRGCCRNDIRRLQWQQHGHLVSYYAFIMRNFGGSEHSNCGDFECVADNVKLGGSYTLRHVQPDCDGSCGFVGVDRPEELAKIIERGGIPLILMQIDNGSISLKVVAGRTCDEYTAISHVWSGGLGNEDANELPRCQVQRLWNMLSKSTEAGSVSESKGDLDNGVHNLLPGLLKLDSSTQQLLVARSFRKGTHLLWMDTLCIPPKAKPGWAQVRQIAISSMNMIYAAATRVCVLDAGLLNMRTSSSSTTELLANIANSSWIHRAWTYQEGALARRCLFHFLDAVVEPCSAFEQTHAPSGHGLCLKEDDLNGTTSRIYTTLRRWMGARLTSTVPIQAVDVVPRGLVASTEKLVISGFFNMIASTIQTQDRRTHDTFSKFHELSENLVQKQPHPAMTQLKKFVLAWNELSCRATSQSVDNLQIFANILELSVIDLMQTEERMRLAAILWTMYYLPVDLLFDVGEKQAVSPGCRNRWIPNRPRRPLYDHESLDNTWISRMRLFNDSLWLQSQAAPCIRTLLFDRTVGLCSPLYYSDEHGQCWSVSSRDKKSKVHTMAERDSFCVLIRTGTSADRMPAIRLVVDEVQKVIIPAEEDNSTGWETFRTEEASHAMSGELTLQILAEYDCPVEICRVSVDEIPSSVLLQNVTVLQSSQPWRLQILCDPVKQSLSHVHSNTPHTVLATWRSTWTNYFTAQASLLLWWYVSLALRIAICVRLGWTSTTTLYKISTITTFLSPLSPIPAVLFLVDRLQQQAIQPIDIVWVVWTFGALWSLLWQSVLFWVAVNIYNLIPWLGGRLR